MAIAGLAAGLESLGHRVRPLGGEPSGGTARRLLYNAALPFRLRDRSFDLVVGFDLDGFAAAGRTRAPYAVCLKGILADELRFEAGRTRRRLALLSRLERRNARRAPVVVVPSGYSRRIAVRRYGLAPERVRVVPEGIDLAAWEGEPPDPDRGGPPTVLSVARQYPRKNTATLLRAFRRVLEVRPEARLRIVGGGPELGRLRTLRSELGLEPAVRLLGPVPSRVEVHREYRRADLFCLPTLQEGFGIVFLEAMAAGLPVVASDVAAVPEVVPDGVAGMLVPPRDPGALASALLRLLADAPLRARMGAAGREQARRFAWPRVAEAFLREALPAG